MSGGNRSRPVVEFAHGDELASRWTERGRWQYYKEMSRGEIHQGGSQTTDKPHGTAILRPASSSIEGYVALDGAERVCSRAISQGFISAETTLKEARQNREN